MISSMTFLSTMDSDIFDLLQQQATGFKHHMSRNLQNLRPCTGPFSRRVGSVGKAHSWPGHKGCNGRSRGIFGSWATNSETNVLPRYKRQFLNHFLKSCNHFIKTLLTILKKWIYNIYFKFSWLQLVHSQFLIVHLGKLEPPWSIKSSRSMKNIGFHCYSKPGSPAKSNIKSRFSGKI